MKKILMDNNLILWGKLPGKKIDAKDYQLRVLRFDPIYLPTMFTPRPYQRHQIVGMAELFPSVNDKCGCGCGQLIKKPRRRWATNDCEKFAVAVRFIVAGNVLNADVKTKDTIWEQMEVYHGLN